MRGYFINDGHALHLTQDHTPLNVLRAEGWLSAEDEDEEALGGSGLAQALDNIFVFSRLA